MRLLCIDTGNTTTHYGIVERRELSRTGGLSTRLLIDGGRAVDDALEGLIREAEGVAYCSVVPAANPAIERWARSRDLPLHHLTREACGELKIAYPKPEEIGEDRLANALAAKVLFGAPAVVIDMGTAVTFDILDAGGAYAGGVIAPGLELMSRYLHEQTALLPSLSDDELGVPVTAIGESTVEAMRIGCVTGFAGMIRELMAAVRAELERRGSASPAVVATGGSTVRLPAGLLSEITVVPGLTLIGAAEAFEQQVLT